ncbi:MAG: DUF1573 domain-containing protein [Paludibacteraceae bacterium]
MKLFFLCFIVVFLPSFSFAGGEISFETSEFDFKEVCLGSPVHHDFVFRNVGEEPLVVKDVRSSCGCVYAAWTASPVAVGDTGSVRVYYKNNVSGTFHKTVKVISNSSRPNRKLPLVIKGESVRKKR